MPFDDLVLTFGHLAAEFDRIGGDAGRPLNVAGYELHQRMIQAGRLLMQAWSRGAFRSEKWWAGGPGQSMFEARLDPQGASLSASSDAGLAFKDDVHKAWHLWRFALGSWLAREHSHLVPNRTGELEWGHTRITTDPEILAENQRRVEEFRDRYDEYTAGAKAGSRGIVRLKFAHPKGYLVRIENGYSEQEKVEHTRMRAHVLAAACRAMVLILKGQVSDDQSTWLPVTRAAELLMKDVLSLSLAAAKTRVSRAANKQNFRSNGRKGTARRIEPTSFDAWRLKQRNKSLDDEDDEG